MYYVSRLLPGNKVGVVDTDDGKEDIFTRVQIRELTCKMGIPIEGVTVSFMENVHRYTVEKIEVSRRDAMDAKAVKRAMLQGVDISTRNGTIVRVSTNQPGMTLRLSDYGVKCGTDIFEAGHIEEPLTVIIDDNIDFTSRSFPYRGYGNMSKVHLDISELTQMKKVVQIYSSFLKNGCSKISWHVTDSPARKDLYETIQCLASSDKLTREVRDKNGRYVRTDEYSSLKQYTDNWLNVNKCLVWMYKAEFAGLAAYDYRNIACGYKWTRDNYDKVRSLGTKMDYETAKRNIDFLWKMLSNSTNYSMHTQIRRFFNYMKHIDLDAGIRSSYVKFANNIVEYLLGRYPR